MALFRAVCKMMKISRIDDFSLKDLSEPKPKRSEAFLFGASHNQAASGPNARVLGGVDFFCSRDEVKPNIIRKGNVWCCLDDSCVHLIP